MAQRKPRASVTSQPSPPRRSVEHFAVPSNIVAGTDARRLDASYFNPAVAQALDTLRHSGMSLAPLGDITSRVFIPPRFKRIYVEPEYGVPFLQGSHIVHFQPADVKYLSRTAHKRLERWIIQAGWLLITCSGTVGRVTMCPSEWDGWAASQHILRIVPDKNACPPGYLYSFLASPLGHVQLTAQIYGAVVDELTEDQAKSVLVPLPETSEQRERVNRIDRDARKAVKIRSRAVSVVAGAVQGISGLMGERDTVKADADGAPLPVVRVKRHTYQPSKAELEQSISLAVTPEELARAAVTPVRVVEED